MKQPQEMEYIKGTEETTNVIINIINDKFYFL